MRESRACVAGRTEGLLTKVSTGADLKHLSEVPTGPLLPYCEFCKLGPPPGVVVQAGNSSPGWEAKTRGDE